MRKKEDTEKVKKEGNYMQGKNMKTEIEGSKNRKKKEIGIKEMKRGGKRFG